MIGRLQPPSRHKDGHHRRLISIVGYRIGWTFQFDQRRSSYHFLSWTEVRNLPVGGVGRSLGWGFGAGLTICRWSRIKSFRVPDLDGLVSQVCHRTESEFVVRVQDGSVPLWLVTHKGIFCPDGLDPPVCPRTGSGSGVWFQGKSVLPFEVCA